MLLSLPAGAPERFPPPLRGRIKVRVRQATVSRRQRPTPILAFPLKGGRDCEAVCSGGLGRVRSESKSCVPPHPEPLPQRGGEGGLLGGPLVSLSVNPSADEYL
jgi:hypothetical protein